jgi:hypothetical protein
MAEQGTDILRANLAALSRTEPELAARVEQATAAELQWSAAPTGWLCASVEHEGRALNLASRYDPAKEADKLVGDIDYQKTACVVVMGMGLGYHVAQVAKAMGAAGVLVVFEPDVRLLRAVLEKIDHTAWLGQANVIVGDAAMDRPALTRRLERFAGIVTQGSQLIAHPPTRQRHGEALREFSQVFTDTLAYCRTNIATALVNSARTCSNLANNLPHYAAGATTDELFHAAKGYPAVCVSAGPSLVRNVDLLRDAQVRKRVVVIAVQTALKPLLDRGVRPDFVTALDYSPICTQFYEELPALADVTLVAEAKAHPSILQAFPGPIRVTQASFNDQLLGELVRPRIPIRPGATVAHLSFYLAQHLGCDPIILIGQDLGFSDGLYYAPGTAVHQVWSSELNVLNTVEMMEWQRIARHKRHLRKCSDIHGRPIYTDEQMATYLKQFERDFATCEQKVLDATEGGMAKASTTQVTLAEALKEHATRDVPRLPLPTRGLDRKRLEAVAELMEKRIGELERMQAITRYTVPILEKMQEQQRDAARMNKLFAELKRNQQRVEQEFGQVFALVNQLNIIGAFRRTRTDRAIGHQKGDELERQRQQIERDIENLRMLDQACDEAMRIFLAARDRLRDSVTREKIYPAEVSAA